MPKRTEHSTLTQVLCLNTCPDLVERDARIGLKNLALYRIEVVLLRDSIVTARLPSGPNTEGSETKAFFHFSAWKSSDSSCKAEVSHPSVHITPYTKYPKMPLQSHVRFHYDPWLQLFPFHFLFYVYSSGCWVVQWQNAHASSADLCLTFISLKYRGFLYYHSPRKAAHVWKTLSELSFWPSIMLHLSVSLSYKATEIIRFLLHSAVAVEGVLAHLRVLSD